MSWPVQHSFTLHHHDQSESSQRIKADETAFKMSTFMEKCAVEIAYGKPGNILLI
jgi:hypothetical protein